MTLTLRLTPETEKRLEAEAARRGQSPTDTALRFVEEALADGSEPEPAPQSADRERAPDSLSGVQDAPKESGQTWGAQMLADLRADDALGAFKDRPEDSPELARKFAEEAARRGPHPCS